MTIKRVIATMAILATTCSTSFVATAAEVSAPPLIERSKLFGNPSRAGGGRAQRLARTKVRFDEGARCHS